MGDFSIFGHGGPGYITNHSDSYEGRWANNGVLFDELMSALSKAFLPYAKDKNLPFTLTIYACNSANESNNASLARKVSIEHPNAIITGFDGLIILSTSKDCAVFIKQISTIKKELANGKVEYDNKGYIVKYKGGKEISRELYTDYLKKKK